MSKDKTDKFAWKEGDAAFSIPKEKRPTELKTDRDLRRARGKKGRSPALA